MRKLIYIRLEAIDNITGVVKSLVYQNWYQLLSDEIASGKRIVRYGDFRMANARLYFVVVS